MNSSVYVLYFGFFFFFKQKTAYEMRISDWSSDVCSSDLLILEWATSSVKDSDYLFHFVEIILFSALAATRGEVRETANSILTKMVATGELPKFENPIIRPIDVPK